MSIMTRMVKATSLARRMALLSGFTLTFPENRGDRAEPLTARPRIKETHTKKQQHIMNEIYSQRGAFYLPLSYITLCCGQPSSLTPSVPSAPPSAPTGALSALVLLKARHTGTTMEAASPRVLLNSLRSLVKRKNNKTPTASMFSTVSGEGGGGTTT